MLAWGLHHVVGANLVECTRTNVRLFVFAPWFSEAEFFWGFFEESAYL